jgi:hypothetical protein
MSAQATAIANIYEPAIWSRYFLEMTTERSQLVQSGIAGSDPAIDAAAAQGGRTVTMPFWDDLPHDTGATTRSKVATDTDDTITPAGITADEDVAVKHFRTQAFQVSPIVNYVSGEDAAGVVLGRFSNWWVREEQRLLLKILYGVFSDATIAAALSKDIAGETTTTDPARLISSSAIEDTRFLLGDAYGKFTSMIVHSTVLKTLRNLGLIDTVPEQSQSLLEPGDYYQGTLRVLCDDGVTKVAGSTSGYKYHTFLFGAGAIARTDIPFVTSDPAIELVRTPLAGTGAGMNTIVTRRYFLMHPRGIKYTGSLSGVVGPSDSDLAADNWDLAYALKNIRLARLITNG